MLYYKSLFWVDGMDYRPKIKVFFTDGEFQEEIRKAGESLEKLMDSLTQQEKEDLAWKFLEHVITYNDVFNTTDIEYHDHLLGIFHKHEYLTFKPSTRSTSKCRQIPKRHHVILADTQGNPKIRASFRTYREMQENTSSNFARVYRASRVPRLQNNNLPKE
jgi:hypothetical protein